MRRNDAVSKRNVEHVKHVIWVVKFEILKSKSDSSKPGRMFFYFIDLLPRYRTWSHPFDFELPVITVFSPWSTAGSATLVFRVRVCARVCEERVVHHVYADLKVKAGMKLKIRTKHRRMLCPSRMPASHSCTPNTHACTVHTHTTYALHARQTRKLLTHATYAT